MRIAEAYLDAMPVRAPDAIAWGEKNFRNPTSPLSERFDCSLTPWVREIIDRGTDAETRVVTFIKPVQSGGSSAGELLLLYWITFSRGLIQYNWSKDGRALDRWRSRIKPMFQHSPAIRNKLKGLGPWDAINCEVNFGNVLFRMQGTYEDDNLDSDTIPLQINEEVHAWEPGKLQKARNRSTAVWNFKSIDISNAGNKGDQLDEAFNRGTAQHWEVKCPSCGNYHRLRSRWDPLQPDMGGLRYEAEGCRRSDGTYDYVKLGPTVRYQFPCGYAIPDDTAIRRALSLSGRYSEPTNPGSPKDRSGQFFSHRSYTLEAVAVDYIPWIELIHQKHLALRAWKLGDQKPFQVYCRERECKFVDPMDRPLAKPLELVTQKKDRAGMMNRAYRLAQLDYQEGEGRELPHWWLSIYDVDKDCNVLLVFEGKCEGDSEAVDALRRHEVNPICVVVDSSYKAKQRIYDFCLYHGFNAIKIEGGVNREYIHKQGDFAGCALSWSEPEDLWIRAGREMPTRPDGLEPEFFLVLDQGAQDLLNHIRAAQGRRFEIPSDVSNDYKSHFAAWSLSPHRVPITNEERMIWKKATEKAPDHLYKCATYLAVQIQMLGLIAVK